MTTKNPKVDTFLRRATHWKEEMETLRAAALACGLHEELKWGKPCYTFQDANVAIVQPFKERCGFMFFKGALLDDPDGVLEAPGPNSRAARRMMFASVDEVVEAEPRLRAFIAQAVDLEKAGVDVPEPTEPEPMPDELSAAFRKDPRLEKAFHALTPGRQRAYLLHFGSAKQSETRTRRIGKCAPLILQGKGLND